MSTQLGQAYIAVRADWDTFSRTVESEGSQRVRGPFTRIGETAAGVFTGVLATRAAAGVRDFLADGIGLASDLNENLSRTSVTFGENQDRVLSFAENAARSLGQSENAALSALNTFGGLFNTLGFGQAQAADASLTYTQLASDLASFGNTSPEEAVEALGAALRGESEPIRRYNVLLDDATLRARAMAMGIYDGVGPLDASTRAQAAYQEILAQTTAAQGDFARTSEGAANQDRIRAAQVENLKTSIGQGLLPIYTRLLTFTNDTLLPALMSFGEWWSEDGAPRVQAFAAMMREELQPVLEAIVAWVVENWPQIQTVIVSVFDAVVAVGQAFVDAFLAFWGLFGDNILAFVQRAWPPVREIIESTLAQIRAVFEIFAGLFSGDWDRVWNGVKDLLGAIWDGIVARVELALAAIQLVLGAAWEVIRNVASAAWEGIKAGVIAAVEGIRSGVGSAIDGVVGFFVGLPDRIGEQLSAIGAAALDIGAEIIDSLIDGITGSAGAVTDIAADLASAIASAFRSVWNNVIADPINSAIRAGVDALDASLGPFVNFDDPPNLVPRLAHTGWITPGGASDEYLTLLRGREAVIPLDMPATAADLMQRAGLTSNRPGISIGQVLVDQSVDFDDQMRRAEMLYDFGLAS